MNANYVKGLQVEKKYRNRTKQDLEADDEYAKFKEEETNSKKMSTILRSLNTTNYKKKLPPAASAQPKHHHKVQQPNAGIRKSLPPPQHRSGPKDLNAIIEDDEIY